MWMTMTGAGYRVAAIQIKIAITVARKNPNTFAALSHDGHLLVGGELVLLFECDCVFQINSCLCFHYILMLGARTSRPHLSAQREKQVVAIQKSLALSERGGRDVRAPSKALELSCSGSVKIGRASCRER